MEKMETRENSTQAKCSYGYEIDETSLLEDMSPNSWGKCRNGCGFQGSSKALSDHEFLCRFQSQSSSAAANVANTKPLSFQCSFIGCTYKLLPQFLDKHEDKCPKGRAKCQYGCGFSGCRKKLKKHESQHENGTVRFKCRYGCCYVTRTQEDLLAHEPLCKATMINCSFLDCTFRGIPPKVQRHAINYHKNWKKCVYGCSFAGRSKALQKHEASCHYGTVNIALMAPRTDSLQDHRDECKETTKDDQATCTLTTVKCEYALEGIPQLVENYEETRSALTPGGLVNNQTYKCRYACNYRFKSREDLSQHEETCVLKVIKCIYGCEFEGTSMDLRLHELYCKTTLISCHFYGCGYRAIPRLMKNHEDACPESMHMCKNGCGFVGQRNGLQEHEDNCRYGTVNASG